VHLPVSGGAPAPADSPAPALEFEVEGAEAVRHAVVPTLSLRVRVERRSGGAVHSIGLATQIRIAATRRSYDEHAQARLVELFGPQEQWSRSLRSLLWTNVSVQVPGFRESTFFDLPITCTYDLEVAGTKYIDALEDGEVPLELLFSGTIFYAGDDGRLRVAPMPWDREAEFRLPVEVWRAVMDQHFPGSAWLRVGRPQFDALAAYKARGGHLTWDQAVDALLREAGGG
jgi:hypothetical protein